jgi:hypothetical protein
MMWLSLGILVSDDSKRRDETKKLNQEALKICQELSQNYPAVHLHNVANTLVAFGYAYLYWDNPRKR